MSLRRICHILLIIILAISTNVCRASNNNEIVHGFSSCYMNASVTVALVNCSTRNIQIERRKTEWFEELLHVSVNRKSDAIRQNPFPELVIFDQRNNNSCVDLKKYDTIVDLTCIYQHAVAFFHQTFECILGNFKLFLLARSHQDQKQTAFILPKLHRVVEFFNFFLPNVSDRRVYFYSLEKHRCYSLSENAEVHYTATSIIWADYFIFFDLPVNHTSRLRMQETSKLFINEVGNLNNILSASPQVRHQKPTILFIHRKNSRIIKNSDQLLRHLSVALPELEVDTFWGEETLVEAISKFSRAKIVIGFHGAGFVHVIYCRENVLIVEITVSKNEAFSKKKFTRQDLWRTNAAVGDLHGSTKWFTYSLRHNLGNIDRDHDNFYQDYLQYISLNIYDIKAIVSLCSRECNDNMKNDTHLNISQWHIISSTRIMRSEFIFFKGHKSKKQLHEMVLKRQRMYDKSKYTREFYFNKEFSLKKKL
jgi:hypothetical protein